MPIDARLDADRRVIRVTVAGSWPTLPEIVAERSRLILAGIIRPGVVELCDARGVTRGVPNLSQMQSILGSVGNPPDKRAILVSANMEFSANGAAKVSDPKALRVFSDEESALAWLMEDEPGRAQVPSTSVGR
jgi:hypothetical protein